MLDIDEMSSVEMYKMLHKVGYGQILSRANAVGLIH